MRALKPSAILAEQSHRPWPIPRHPWVMAQTWHNLLFAHWPLPPDALRRLIPPGLQLDTFDEEAWVGVIPFHMSDIRARAPAPAEIVCFC